MARILLTDMHSGDAAEKIFLANWYFVLLFSPFLGNRQDRDKRKFYGGQYIIPPGVSQMGIWVGVHFIRVCFI